MLTAEEFDEWVRRCRVLEDLVRKLSDQVEYDPSEYVWRGQIHHSDPRFRGDKTRDESILTPAEEKVCRQVISLPELITHADVEI